MDKKVMLSIVTPTYNRAGLLKNCYQSLLNQTDKRFEWIVVDDGSTDNTAEVVTEFKKKQSDIDVIYVRKDNGGKHTALNASHPFINGSYVLILDSDDTLVDTAVEEVLKYWEKYNNNEEIGIVTFLKGRSVDQPNAYAEDEGVPVDIMTYKRTCVFSGDCCEVIRTELFKKFPFPVYPGEKFMSEGVLWSRVSFSHKCVYINKVIYLAEYLEGGLTKSGRSMRIKNPRGGMFNSEIRMARKNNIRNRFKSGLLFICYGFFAGMTPRQIMSYSSKNHLIKGICLVPGYCMYRLWKKKYSG